MNDVNLYFFLLKFYFDAQFFRNMAATANAKLDDIFSMNDILNEFVQFLPILTLSNFIRSFPQHKYDQLSSIKEVYALEKSIDYSKLQIGICCTNSNDTRVICTDIETNKVDSNTVRSLIDKHTYTYQETVTVNRIRIAHMHGLIQVILTKLYGKQYVDQTISATDSIGLHDVAEIEENFDSDSPYYEKSPRAVAAHFVLLFLAVILPVDRVTLQSRYFWLYTAYYHERIRCGAIASGYYEDEEYSFSFQNGDKSIRKVCIVTINR